MSSNKKIDISLKIWRQRQSDALGVFKNYSLQGVDTASSFLEMLDMLNETLVIKGEEPIAFDTDCREGICGTCGAVVNGEPHGPWKKTTLCQLHMREFSHNQTIIIEPFRARALPLVRDLVVDKSAFDRIMQSGGFISVNSGGVPDANSILISQVDAEGAMDAAQCIGCSACVAACPNASAMLFVGAKVSQYALLPQGQLEAKKRVKSMVQQMDVEGFGNCSNEYMCEAACPKGISVSNIARMNREFLFA
jgi:succinate dehydrogenase / fumarate reductase, iron-sulfur subunit